MAPIIDPIQLQRRLWPHVAFYRKQLEVIYSVRDNYVTMVPAGNMLGKDFVAGYIALWFFLAHKTCRVITTSVKDDHLRVLWGEIDRFVIASQQPLKREQGGPLICNHRDIRKIVNKEPCPISYLRGMVSAKGEGMAGHHAPNTLAIIDEASGVDDEVFTQIETWASRILVIGNPNACNNFFYRGVKEGDLLEVDA